MSTPGTLWWIARVQIRKESGKVLGSNARNGHVLSYCVFTDRLLEP